MQTRAFASLPVNSGIIQLSEKARAALDRAKNLVRDYCPALARLPSEQELYGTEAVRSGLACDFAMLVSTQMSRVGLCASHSATTQCRRCRSH